MSADTGNAPSWLFSFVDLAFLSLIAMTQLASNVDVSTPDLAEMVVPQIGSEATDTLATGAADLWQLRVHPPDDAQISPFQLYHSSEIREGVVKGGVDGGVEGALEGGAEGGLERGAEGGESGISRLAFGDLRERLLELHAAQGTKPLLAPHEDSRSQDMLDAAALIEEIWPSRRRALVSRTDETS